MSEDLDREARIESEIVVDCYDETERAMGWYYYLESNLSFPFEASCIAPGPGSPLHAGDQVVVNSMSDEEQCMTDMMVEVTYNAKPLRVPLRQLRGHSRSRRTKQAIADWHYWVFRGYEF